MLASFCFLRLAKLQKRREHREQEPAEKQEVRLPPSSGAPAVIELEALPGQRAWKVLQTSLDLSGQDLDDWLPLVLDHRRRPPNDKKPGCAHRRSGAEFPLICLSLLDGTFSVFDGTLWPRNPSSLCVLEGLGDSAPTTCGPGVETVRRIYADPVALKEHKSGLRRKRGSSRWRPPSNPVGHTVPGSARYDAVLPEFKKLPALTHSASLPATSSGVFFQTEVKMEEAAPVVLKTSSVPNLPRLGLADELPEMSTTVELKGSLEPEASDPVESKTANSKQSQRLMKAFQKAVSGRSILIFTDKADVRKGIMRSLICAAREMDICFACSSNDFWKRLQDTKERYHALIVDLGKSELEAEGLVKTVRADAHYGGVPIVVLSQERDLPELVRKSCSFVVFHPLSSSMLREALLWCFNRSALRNQSYYFPAGQQADYHPQLATSASSTSLNLTVRARRLKL